MATAVDVGKQRSVSSKRADARVRSEPQIGYHYRKVRRGGVQETVYARWKWLRRYRAYKRWLLWKTERNK